MNTPFSRDTARSLTTVDAQRAPDTLSASRRLPTRSTLGRVRGAAQPQEDRICIRTPIMWMSSRGSW